jgi:chorismate mutase/prephenate dehydratase
MMPREVRDLSFDFKARALYTSCAIDPGLSRMPDTTEEIERLRRQIDEIDDSIHDGIMRRADIVRRVAEIKNGQGAETVRTYLRPGREAEILRRLAARHHGDFPLSELTRIWREMITGFTRLQGPFAVAVCTGAERGDLWDVARDHYGSHTPMTAFAQPMQTIRAVADGSHTVAVLPWPEDDVPDPWWRMLASDDSKTPRIIGRLPFVVGERTHDDPQALSVAQIAAEKTGDDHSLLVIELEGDVSRSRLKLTLETAGLTPVAFWSRGSGHPGDRPMLLIEIADFVAPDDARLALVRTGLVDNLLRAQVIGGFACPIRREPAPTARA